ncbi:sphinganine C4-monooxygenase 2-like, partial [Cannabis sativa]|uniref:sphinganine C4-monooxygenase 2-like n=1 Tax=Cannabis sativa TaxID=3483 RepID=UPI0029CA6BDC
IVADEILGIFVPILVYWVYYGMYLLLDLKIDENYRLHTKRDEMEKNTVDKSTVIKGVLLQQFIQAITTTICYMVRKYIYIIKVNRKGGDDVDGDDNNDERSMVMTIIILGWQWGIAMLVVDTWQYFMHRYMHQNKYLYKYIHSQHHRLVVPYAFGALYNHPLEGLLVDTMSGALSFFVSGMSPKTSIFFFSFATIKAIDDHCGLCLPWNPFHIIFKNNTLYHDVHHQLYGNKFNFSQPFLVMWDKLFGTYLPPTTLHCVPSN